MRGRSISMVPLPSRARVWMNSVAISTDGRGIFSGSYDKTVRVWHGRNVTCALSLFPSTHVNGLWQQRQGSKFLRTFTALQQPPPVMRVGRASAETATPKAPRREGALGAFSNVADWRVDSALERYGRRTRVDARGQSRRRRPGSLRLTRRPARRDLGGANRPRRQRLVGPEWLGDPVYAECDLQ